MCTDCFFSDGKYVQKGTGEKVTVRYEKMSKSKHNGVDPGVTASLYVPCFKPYDYKVVYRNIDI